MILGEGERPRSADFLAVLIRDVEELAQNGFRAIKRMFNAVTISFFQITPYMTWYKFVGPL